VCVRVVVTDAAGGPAGEYVFVLVQRQVGRKAGCWMTKQLVRVA